MDIHTMLFEIVLLPLLGALTSFLIAYLQIKRKECLEKMENETAKKYLNMLHDTVFDCVTVTNQTYVEALKKEGKFDLEAQKEAFEQTKDAVLNLLSAEAINYLQTALVDLDAYINTQIEAAVNRQK